MATVTVTIICDKNKGLNRVWPPCACLERNDKLVFKAIGTDAKVELPGAVFDNTSVITDAGNPQQVQLRTKTGGTQVFDLRVTDKHSHSSAKVKDTAPFNVYEYEVTCDATGGCKAQGLSTPVLIIEPPGP